MCIWLCIIYFAIATLCVCMHDPRKGVLIQYTYYMDMHMHTTQRKYLCASSAGNVCAYITPFRMCYFYACIIYNHKQEVQIKN